LRTGAVPYGRRNAAARALATKRGQARSAIAALRRLLAIAEAGNPSIGEDEIMELLNRASP
jgi:Cdc6-like AAA superfamily ATPase